MEIKKLYLKLTTLPQTENLQTESVEFELFKNKYSEAREYMKDSDVLHSYYNDASKTPSFAKIYSMTMGVVDGNETMQIIQMKGEERLLLQTLLNKLSVSPELVCFNLGFNLGFITTRMLKNEMDTSNLPLPIKHLNSKPWNLKQNKGMSEWFNGASWFKMGAEELFFTAGLDISNIIDGADVYTYYKTGRIEEIDNSDVFYLKNLINVERISLGENTLEKYNTYFQELSESTAEEEKLPVLNRIYLNKTITKEDKKELVSLIGKKRLLKKDKPILIDIIHKLSLNTAFDNKDKEEVVEEKLKVVEELINNL